MMRGTTKAARIARMATTTMISMNVKPAVPPHARGVRRRARGPWRRRFLLHIVHMSSTCSLSLIEYLPLDSSLLLANHLSHLKDGQQDRHHDTEHQDTHDQDHDGFQERCEPRNDPI